MSKKQIICIACNDTGLNSKGGLCYPCRSKSRQPLRDAAIASLTDLFNTCFDEFRLPSEDEIIESVKWACAPKVQYAAGYRGKDSAMGIFAGPVIDLDEMLAVIPPIDRSGRTAFIIEMVWAQPRGELITAPVARWKDGQWQKRRKNDA